MKIKSLRAREILDSRGWPTVEVTLATSNFFSKAAVPSGTSTGKYEAWELRDGGKRYFGKGVQKAVANINKIIAPRIIGKDSTKQKEIDRFLINLDGTKNKSRLGANAILAVSMAACRSGAKAQNLPLYKYIGKVFNFSLKLPNPCFLMIEGALHAGNSLDIQEFMISPRENSFKEKLRAGTETYHTLGKILEENYGKAAINVGLEGGFTAPMLKKSEKALDLIKKSIKIAGYQKNIKIMLDVAASSFFKNNIYKFEGKTLSNEKLLNFYQKLVQKYPIFAIEDPFSENDFKGFREINKQLNKKILIVGDDLLVTNSERVNMANINKLCNAMILKLNQIGTVTEAIETAKMAKRFGWKIIVSHRSGETTDGFISDLAVGISAEFIKTGAPARGERVVKYNRLLEIEEEIHPVK
jgi:enolase